MDLSQLTDEELEREIEALRSPKKEEPKFKSGPVELEQPDKTTGWGALAVNAGDTASMGLFPRLAGVTRGIMEQNKHGSADVNPNFIPTEDEIPELSQAFKEGYASEKKAVEDYRDAAWEEHPGASIAGSFVGGAATVPFMAAKAPQAATRLGQMAKNAYALGKTGTTYGGLYGLGSSEDWTDAPMTAWDVAMNAGIGGLAGGAFGTLGGAVARRGAKKIAKNVDVKSQPALAAESTAGYKAIEKEAAQIAQNKVIDLANDIRSQVKSRGVTKRAFDTMDEVNKTIGPKALKQGLPTYDQIMDLKRIIAGQRGKTNADKTALRNMVAKIDDWFDNLSDNDLASITTKGVDELNKIRKASDSRWRRAMTSKELADRRAIPEGKTIFGKETSKTVKKALKDTKRARGNFPTKAEREILDKAAYGNLVSKVADMGATFNPFGFKGGVGAMGAHWLGGPIAGGTAFTAPLVARQVSHSMARNRANLADLLIRANPQQRKLIQQQASGMPMNIKDAKTKTALTEALIRALIAGHPIGQ